MSLEHPSGVTLPLDIPTDVEPITRDICGEIRSGAYNADLVRRLADAVMPGDRVLVIGAGLAVVSTLVARVEGVDRVIVAEPNTALLPHLDRIHDLNGVSEIETINAVLAVGKKGRIPYCAQWDPRTSILSPYDQSWQQGMLVPLMDLNLILTEERITLIICDTPTAPVQLLAQAELVGVDRILLNCGDETGESWDGDAVCTHLVRRGYHSESSGAAIVFRRSVGVRSGRCQRKSA